MCQLAWRSGCSEADRTLTSGGGSAADVTSSAANGAAVEPPRALQCPRGFSGPGHRAWRVPGVAIWRAPQRAKHAQRSASPPVRQAGLVHAQREGTKARDPRARERAAVDTPAGSAGLTVLREGWQPVRGETPARPVARRAAQQPGRAQRGHAPSSRPDKPHRFGNLHASLRDAGGGERA